MPFCWFCHESTQLWLTVILVTANSLAVYVGHELTGPGHAKKCFMPYENNKAADQPAHPRSLISTFVFRCLDSMICILAISEVLRL